MSCLEAQQEHPSVAAVRRNADVDLEEDVEEDSDSHFPLCSLTLSLAMILLPRINIKNSEDHPKGDCHHTSVVCRHSLKGLPAA